MTRHPVLFQVNTRIVLEELTRSLRQRVGLDDLVEPLLDSLREAPVDWVWLLGVWTTGDAGLAVSRADPDIRRELAQALPDLDQRDITGSPFSIRGYDVRSEWGGSAALARAREHFARRGVRLLLDFVPNHVALDHPWLDEHPEYLIAGTEADLLREPQNYVRLRSRDQDAVFAYGRDPNFPGWSDTLQLNYCHAGLRRSMTEQLLRLSRLCDGVRCDMAMLLLPDVFQRTWGERSRPADGSEPVATSFWSEALAAVRASRPDFVFMAEAYWDLEWRLQQEGFDFTYDKRLYDRLRSGSARAVREHLLADPEYQKRSVRFLENHDEARAAAAFPPDVHQAAALITYFAPGMRFFHEGQFEGRRIRTSLHVGRRAAENPDAELARFYARLLECLRRPEVHAGEFRMHECRAAWHGNSSFEDLIVFSWLLDCDFEARGRGRRVSIAVNFSAHRSQGYVTLALPELSERMFLLSDLLGDARYERSGNELSERGLYLDLPAWGHHFFEWRQESSDQLIP